jgi:hypothetical protein
MIIMLFHKRRPDSYMVIGNKNYTVKIDNQDELLSAELITDKIPDINETNNILNRKL